MHPLGSSLARGEIGSSILIMEQKRKFDGREEDLTKLKKNIFDS